MKLHTGFRAAAKAVLAKGPDTAMPALAPVAPAIPKPAAPIKKSALRNKLPSMAPKKTGAPFGGKPAPLFKAKALQF